MPRKAKAIQKEEKEQILFAIWLTKKGVKFTASANGGKRNLYEAMKLKRMGVSAGFPDIFIPVPMFNILSNVVYHGLFIELKRKSGGKISNFQKEWINYLREKGYKAEIARGFDEAKEIVLNYLGR